MATKVKRYLKGILDANEKVVCAGGLHWIYLSSGMVWLAFLAAMGWGADYALWHYFGQYVPEMQYDAMRLGLAQNAIAWLFTACGIIIFFSQFLRYITTEITVTTVRVISKTGFLNIRTDGTDISDIRGTHVDQGWLGRFLNYGKIRFDCRFIDDVNIPYVRDPYKFTRHIQRMKTELEDRASNPIDPHHQHAYQPQTVIQIATGPAGAEIVQKDERTILVQPHLDKPLAIDHHLHDDILNDFKNKA